MLATIMGSNANANNHDIESKIRNSLHSVVPNSKLPILIYRNLIPHPDDHDGIAAILNGNGYRVDGFMGAMIPRTTPPTQLKPMLLSKGMRRSSLGKGPVTRILAMSSL